MTRKNEVLCNNITRFIVLFLIIITEIGLFLLVKIAPILVIGVMIFLIWAGYIVNKGINEINKASEWRK